MGRGAGKEQQDLGGVRRSGSHHSDRQPEQVKLEVYEQQAMLIRPGLIDDAAHAAFSSGQCHALALALHEQTGWSLRVIEDDDADIVHVYVETPDGRALDIAGIHADRDDYRLSWGSYDEPASEQEVTALAEHGGWREPNLEVARTFVPELLKYVSGEKANLAAPGIDDVPRVDTVPLEKYVVPGLDGRRHVLRPGVFDDEAQRAFALGGGQAHALSWGLVASRQTWKAAVLWKDDEPLHTVALTPEGLAVDVDGARDVETIRRQYAADEIEPVRWKDLDGVMTEHDWPSFDIATARSFAPALLEKLGL